MVSRLLTSWLVRIGLGLLIIGTGPLVLVILAADLGLTDDPNPNPIGLGMLAMLTFWPSVLLIAAGAIRVLNGGERRARTTGTPGAVPSPRLPRRSVATGALLETPIARALAGAAGLYLVLAGAIQLVQVGGRGPASMIVIGVAGVWYSVAGRLPGWLKPRWRG